jgi:molybdate transport system regulatory protein
MPKPQLQLADALGHSSTDKRLEILRLISEAGSISEAARMAGVSYKAAWQAIDTLSNLAGAPLLDRAVGGSGGGGAKLTDAGLHLLWVAEQLQAARSQTLALITNPQLAPSARLGALGLRTSMRNQLPCTVHAMKKVGGAMRVSLALSQGLHLVSRITQESAQLLDLKTGLPVLALFKATAVHVCKPSDSPSQNAEERVVNYLPGIVTRLSKSAAGGEAALQLADDLQLVGFAPAQHGLRLKAHAVASLDESAVAIALG